MQGNVPDGRGTSVRKRLICPLPGRKQFRSGGKWSDLQLQSYPALPAGNYWLAMSVLGAAQPVGWLVCDPTYPPNMYQYNNGWGTVAYDGWFGLYDHDVALSRTTWGSIKSVF